MQTSPDVNLASAAALTRSPYTHTHPGVSASVFLGPGRPLIPLIQVLSFYHPTCRTSRHAMTFDENTGSNGARALACLD